MKLQVENSIWHAFDYLSMENGKQSANKSKLKVSANLIKCINVIWIEQRHIVIADKTLIKYNESCYERLI